MKVSLIIGTLGEREEEFKRLLKSLVDQSYKALELIVVAQGNYDIVEKLLNQYKIHSKLIKINKKGLSNARNEGLKYVSGNIVTFSDDDCWYPRDAMEKVVSDFKSNSYEVICYKIFDPISKQDYKNYGETTARKLGTKEIYYRSSIELFFNYDVLKGESAFKFDVNFGLGAGVNSGEEIILLNDLHKRNYTIYFKNTTIVYHRKKATSPKVDIRFLKGKKLFLYRLFGKKKGAFIYSIYLIKKFPKLIKSNQ